MLQQCTVLSENKQLANQQNAIQHNSCAQTQDFSNIFYKFTQKIDDSSHQIISFYDQFIIQKLNLAQQHIEQISKLSQLQKPRKRIADLPIINQLQKENQAVQLKKIKEPKIQQKSPKKVFDDKFMNDLSKDLLQLDLDFMDDYDTTSSQQFNLSHKKSIRHSQKRKADIRNNDNQAFQLKINGQAIHDSAINNKQKQHDNEERDMMDNVDIYQTKQSRKSKKGVMINENSPKQNKQNVNLDVHKGDKFRKSLIDQFSEIKVKDKKEVQSEKKYIQDQIEQINIEDFCTNPQFTQINIKPDTQPHSNNSQSNQTNTSNSSNSNSNNNNNNMNDQESLLLPGSSSISSEGVLQLNLNDNAEYVQGNTMQKQNIPEGFFMHGNNIIIQAEEQEEDNEYEMTDYSSNESSNMGSPVFNWKSKEESLNDKIFFNDLSSSSFSQQQQLSQQYQQQQQQNYNIQSQPFNKYNSKNKNIFECSSQSDNQSNENSKNFNNIPQMNGKYFSQNTFGHGFDQQFNSNNNNPTDESSNSQANFKNFYQSQFSQDSFSGMNFSNLNQQQQQQQQQQYKDNNIFSSQYGGNNSNIFGSMKENNDSSNSANLQYQHNKKLLYSPQKLKTVKQRKILYCNNKEVPSWAQDLSKVTQNVREQKVRGDDPLKLFGCFAVENLNLREVFKDTGKKYDQGRGSSANWRQDCTPEQIESLINATSQTPSRKQKVQSKFKSFLQNSFNSIKKKLIQ